MRELKSSFTDINIEQANRMTMLEMYIPGFAGPTFKD